jgi:hypothetical protein
MLTSASQDSLLAFQRFWLLAALALRSASAAAYYLAAANGCRRNVMLNFPQLMCAILTIHACPVRQIQSQRDAGGQAAEIE